MQICQVQGPAHTSKQSQAQIQFGQSVDQVQPYGEGLEGIGRTKSEYEPVMCTCSLESQPHLGFHQTKLSQ